MSLALDQELAFLFLPLKYKKYLKLAYESSIAGALKKIMGSIYSLRPKIDVVLAF
jgi:hypothetical protein